MKKIALALVALTVAAPAYAQDATVFTGGHVSGVVGYDVIDLNTAGLDNPSGVVFGANVGYDFQTGGAVIGLEGEVTDASSKIEVANVTVASAARDLYVGARLGFVAGRTLVYAKAGYTNARIESIAGNANADGVRVGAGAEMRLGANLFGKVEYRYSNYEAEVERHQVVAGVGFRF